MAESHSVLSGLTEENTHLFLPVIRSGVHGRKSTVVSKGLPSYACSLENHREKHPAKKKSKGAGKILSPEEQIYLICEDSKSFFKEFHDGPSIVERFVDFKSIPDYQLEECFNFLHVKDLVSERIPFYQNLVAMFYANLRIKRNPLTLYSLVKGKMITLDEQLLGAVLGIAPSGPKIFGKSFFTLNWNASEALSLLFGVRVQQVTGVKASYPINCLTPRAHVLAKIAQFNFLPQGGHFHVVKMDCLVLLFAMLTFTHFNLPHFLLNSMIMPREQLAFPCLLTKIFLHYDIPLENETPILGKECFGSATINRMFLPRNNVESIMKGETQVEEDARLKQHHRGKIPGNKKRKVDTKGKRALDDSSNSDDDSHGDANLSKFNRLQKDVTWLKNSFRKFKASVKADLSELKQNLKRLVSAMGHSYSSRPATATSSSEDPDDVPFQGKDPVDLTSAAGTHSRKPRTRSSTTNPLP